MTSFRRILLLALVCAPLIFAADQLTGFPFQNETLHYRVNWPGGDSLGDVTMTAHKAGDGGWDFEMSTTRGHPGGADLRQLQIVGQRHGSLLVHACSAKSATARRRSARRPSSIRRRIRRQRQTLVPAGGGKSEFAIPTCARDALTFQYLARREMGQGRVPPAGRVFFGSAYDVKTVYTGAQDIPVAGKPVVTDHVNVSVKGPASDFTFEIFYARDAARTPLLIKIPVSVGTVSLELVR